MAASCEPRTLKATDGKEAVAAPGVEYAFRFVFCNRRSVYTVALQDGARWLPLAAVGGQSVPEGASAFPLAASAPCVSAVEFSGIGLMKALYGKYESVLRGFRFSIR